LNSTSDSPKFIVDKALELALSRVFLEWILLSFSLSFGVPAKEGQLAFQGQDNPPTSLLVHIKRG
jgi:hypothetical protein